MITDKNLTETPICNECELIELDTHKRGSCPNKMSSTMEQDIFPILELDNGTRWIARAPAAQ